MTQYIHQLSSTHLSESSVQTPRSFQANTLFQEWRLHSLSLWLSLPHLQLLLLKTVAMTIAVHRIEAMMKTTKFVTFWIYGPTWTFCDWSTLDVVNTDAASICQRMKRVVSLQPRPDAVIVVHSSSTPCQRFLMRALLIVNVIAKATDSPLLMQIASHRASMTRLRHTGATEIRSWCCQICDYYMQLRGQWTPTWFISTKFRLWLHLQVVTAPSPHCYVLYQYR